MNGSSKRKIDKSSDTSKENGDKVSGDSEAGLDEGNVGKTDSTIVDGYGDFYGKVLSSFRKIPINL